LGLIIPYKFEEEKRQAKLTGLTGMLLPLELMYAMELDKEIQKQIKVRPTQGYSDGKEIISLILLNLAGGEHVEDIKQLKGDIGFNELAKEASERMINPKIAERAKKRFRKLQEEGFPSPSAIHRYLFEFHDEQEEIRRQKSDQAAFIPKQNEHLQGLSKLNNFIAGYKQRIAPQETATLDQDATVIETSKSDALFCYKGYRSYQPINTYWHEQGIVIHSEFRDGNVPAGFQNLRILEESLESLPKGVKIVRFRADTAAYQHEILRYCEESKNKRFGRIEFAISCDVTAEFRKAVLKIEEPDWKPLKKNSKANMWKVTSNAQKSVLFLISLLHRPKQAHPPKKNLFIDILQFVSLLSQSKNKIHLSLNLFILKKSMAKNTKSLALSQT